MPNYKLIISGTLFWGGLALVWWQTTPLVALGVMMCTWGITAYNKPDDY